MADADQPPRVLADDRQDTPLDVDGLVALARTVLVGEGAPDTELSVSFVTEDEMGELHERFTGESGPTDVLSFPLDEEAEQDGVRLVGDVVIAPSVAVANNPDDPSAELRLLIVHGVLHLLGHDHERDDDKAEMWARQERYAGVEVP
jgi:probable rRNA maturation factor